MYSSLLEAIQMPKKLVPQPVSTKCASVYDAIEYYSNKLQTERSFSQMEELNQVSGAVNDLKSFLDMKYKKKLVDCSYKAKRLHYCFEKFLNKHWHRLFGSRVY